MLSSQEFGVDLVRGTAHDFQTFQTVNKQMAADMAEKANPGWRAVAVSIRREIVGRCRRCKTVLFDDDHVDQSSLGLKCGDC